MHYLVFFNLLDFLEFYIYLVSIVGLPKKLSNSKLWQLLYQSKWPIEWEVEKKKLFTQEEKNPALFPYQVLFRQRFQSKIQPVVPFLLDMGSRTIRARVKRNDFAYPNLALLSQREVDFYWSYTRTDPTTDFVQQVTDLDPRGSNKQYTLFSQDFFNRPTIGSEQHELFVGDFLLSVMKQQELKMFSSASLDICAPVHLVYSGIITHEVPDFDRLMRTSCKKLFGPLSEVRYIHPAILIAMANSHSTAVILHAGYEKENAYIAFVDSYQVVWQAKLYGPKVKTPQPKLLMNVKGKTEYTTLEQWFNVAPAIKDEKDMIGLLVTKVKELSANPKTTAVPWIISGSRSPTLKPILEESTSISFTQTKWEEKALLEGAKSYLDTFFA